MGNWVPLLWYKSVGRFQALWRAGTFATGSASRWTSFSQCRSNAKVYAMAPAARNCRVAVLDSAEIPTPSWVGPIPGIPGGRNLSIYLTRRNYIVFYGQANESSKVILFSEILSQKVEKKMQNFDKNPLFWDSDRFLTIFAQPVIQEPPNLALFYSILSFSELIWSFNTGHFSDSSVRSSKEE